ncbi:MAG: BamA/TamA family outer membrane protein [Rhodobacteraceae bacterium]|nr:BamA/TamA family outer membrane protein [Paracoccaceae bacterium]
MRIASIRDARRDVKTNASRNDLPPKTSFWALGVVTGLFIVPLLVTDVLAQPPSVGSVLKQTERPPVPLAVPGSILELSDPIKQTPSPSILIPVGKIIIEGNHWIDTAKLSALVQSAEGQNLTLDALRGYVDLITEAYHSAGYLVAYAYLPPQTVRDGVIRIAVVEPTYDKIKITGTSRLAAAQVLRTLHHLESGAPVARAPLTRGLLLLNQTPGVEVKGTLLPGSQPHTTTLQIKPTDLAPVTGGLSISNSGSPYTGSSLANVGLSANNLFGSGESVAINASVSSGSLKTGDLSLTSPDFGNGLRLGLYGSATTYKLRGAFANLDQSGRAQQTGIDLTYPLLLSEKHVLNLRADAIRNLFLQHTGATNTTASQAVSLMRIAFDGVFQDAGTGQNLLGQTSGGIAFSHGVLSYETNDERAADASGPQAAGAFNMVQIRLERMQPLPRNFTLTASLTAQLSNRNLDSSQKFFLGGPNGVMSLPVGAVGGDQGYLLRLRLSHNLKVPYLSGTFTGSLLATHGKIWTNHTPYAGSADINQTSATAIGIGIDYATRGWHLNSSVITPVGHVGAVNSSTHAWLAAQISF